jgi:hypothetical protein
LHTNDCIRAAGANTNANGNCNADNNGNNNDSNNHWVRTNVHLAAADALGSIGMSPSSSSSSQQQRRLPTADVFVCRIILPCNCACWAQQLMWLAQIMTSSN